MKIFPGFHNERPVPFHIEMTHEDLTEAADNTAQAIVVFKAKAGDTLLCANTVVEEYFEDASDNALNTTALTLGDAGDAARLLASQELNVNGTEVYGKASPPAKVPYTYPEDTDIVATFGSMTDKALEDIDTGKLHIFLHIHRAAQSAKLSG